jgi:hypothetical protein
MKSTAGYGASVVTRLRGVRREGPARRLGRHRPGHLHPESGAAKLTVRAHTDATAANMIVTVDGKPFASTNVERQTWVNTPIPACFSRARTP